MREHTWVIDEGDAEGGYMRRVDEMRMWLGGRGEEEKRPRS